MKQLHRPQVGSEKVAGRGGSGRYGLIFPSTSGASLRGQICHLHLYNADRQLMPMVLKYEGETVSFVCKENSRLAVLFFAEKASCRGQKLQNCRN